MDLALGLEQAVAGFPRMHRYAPGAELRRSAQQIRGGVMRCARVTGKSFSLQAQHETAFETKRTIRHRERSEAITGGHRSADFDDFAFEGALP
jgi:hypothetical protein